MNLLPMKGKIASIGRCIYCGQEGDPGTLGDEHIIPESLGGRAWIEDASCRACERAISYVEGYCAREIFKEVRIHRGIKGKRRKRKPIDTLPVTFNVGGVDQPHQITAADHPSALVLPVLPLPGRMTGEVPAATWKNATVCVWQTNHSNENVNSIARVLGATSLTLNKNVKIRPLTRLLAKIAHSFAVAKLGYGSFTPVLIDIILGKDDSEVAYYIGGDLNANPPSTALHLVQAIVHPLHDVELIVVGIRLFADMGPPNNGLPIYYVVVGERVKVPSLP